MDTEKISKIQELSRNGLPIREIAGLTKVSKSQVHRVIANMGRRTTIQAPAPRISRVAPVVAPVAPTQPQVIQPLSSNGFDMSQFVPQVCEKYVSRKLSGKLTDLQYFRKCYDNKLKILLVGDSGCGKSLLCEYFAYVNKLPYARVNLNGGTTASDLLGRWIPKAEGGYKWVDGLLTLFVRNGGVFLLDEANFCPAEILGALNSLLDGGRRLVLTGKDSEVVHAHPNFFLVCAMNPPEYEGTKPLNHSFKDRFEEPLIFDYDTAIEDEIISDRDIKKLADKLRIMRKKGEIATPVSTRKLMSYEKNKTLFGEKFAMELFINYFETHEREPIKNVIEMLNKPEPKENEDGKNKK